jgi:hypothetical protein
MDGRQRPIPVPRPSKIPSVPSLISRNRPGTNFAGAAGRTAGGLKSPEFSIDNSTVAHCYSAK